MADVELELLLGVLGVDGSSASEIDVIDAELLVVSFVGVLFTAFTSRATGDVCDELERGLSMFFKRVGCDLLLIKVGRFVVSATPCEAFHVLPPPFSDSALGELDELPVVCFCSF